MFVFCLAKAGLNIRFSYLFFGAGFVSGVVLDVKTVFWSKERKFKSGPKTARFYSYS
jgi:hypothetical protein